MCYNTGRGSKGNIKLSQNQINQIVYYTRCITPKRVTSLRGPISASLRPKNTTSFKEMSQWQRSVGNTMPSLIGSRFKPQTFSSNDIDQLTGQQQTNTATFNSPFFHQLKDHVQAVFIRVVKHLKTPGCKNNTADMFNCHVK